MISIPRSIPAGNESVSHPLEKETHRLKSVLGRDMLARRRVDSLQKKLSCT